MQGNYFASREAKLRSPDVRKVNLGEEGFFFVVVEMSVDFFLVTIGECFDGRE
jgi:hypothetical protein